MRMIFKSLKKVCGSLSSPEPVFVDISANSK